MSNNYYIAYAPAATYTTPTTRLLSDDDFKLQEEEAASAATLQQSQHSHQHGSRRACPTCGHTEQADAVVPASPFKQPGTTSFTLTHGWMCCSDQDIADAHGNPAFHIDVRGCWLLDLKLASVSATGSKTTAMVKQTCHIKPKFDIYLNGATTKYATAKMRCKWSLKIKVKFANGDAPLVIRGGHLGKNYQILRNKSPIAQAHRSWGRHDYNVLPGEDQLFMHCLIALTDKALSVTKRKLFIKM